MRRATKIVCTLGPASLSEDTIAAMIGAGMDVARLNTSHGSLEEHARAIELVRSAGRRVGKDVAILLDLAGPKLRTGPTEGGRPLNLVDGQRVRITERLVHGTEELFTIAYPHLLEDVRPGTRILLDDGLIELEAESVEDGCVVARVVHGGLLGPNKGVHIPGAELSAAPLTERDVAALQLGIERGVDFVALSFVRRPQDLRELREQMLRAGGEVPVVAKIERQQALHRLEEIVAEADGVMVARGDLGVEVGPAEVPIWQRRIIAAAAREKVPVITATQMLESMIDSPRPTRAEASDVA
ncbi:MAG: pyruvate kinase, partial [Dehalococcoidia bacterium]|nr:pyruvate kinase [Dehalococcoidia bacterium]